MFLLNTVLNSLIVLMSQNSVPWQIIWEYIGLNLDLPLSAGLLKAITTMLGFLRGKLLNHLLNLPVLRESLFSHVQTVNI